MIKHALLCISLWFLVYGPHPSVSSREPEAYISSDPSVQHEDTINEASPTEYVPLISEEREGIDFENRCCGIAHGSPVPKYKSPEPKYSSPAVAAAYGSPVPKPTPEAPRRRFPYMCSLGRAGGEEHACGGVLIDEQWVLTAAHCLQNNEGNGLGHYAMVRCGIREVDERDPDTLYQSKRAYWHPQWNGDVTHGFDIGLVRLDRKSPLKRATVDKVGDTLSFGRRLAVVGWGETETKARPSVLQVSDKIPVLLKSSCEESLEETLKDHMICAGGIGSDTCRGDSGGPLLIPHEPDGSLSQGNPSYDVIVGITSFGNDACDGETPSVYTRVSAFWDWIKDTIDRETTMSESVDMKAKEFFAFFSKHIKVTPRQQQVMEILLALEKDENWKVEEGLKGGVSPDATYHNAFTRHDLFLGKGSTLLHWAAAFDAADSVEVLKESEADVNRKNTDHLTPLHTAAIYGSATVAEALLEFGADPNAASIDGQTPLTLASEFGRLDVVKLLLKKGADIEAACRRGQTPLHWAVIYSKKNIVETLLERGANINAARNDGWTALHFVAESGNAEMAKMLIAHGADPNAQDAEKRTPLLIAAEVGQLDVVEVLISNGADKEAADVNGWKPLSVAADSEHIEIMKLLVDEGVDVEERSEGWTPLLVSSYNEDLNAVKYLLNKGANPNAADKMGETALYKAVEAGGAEVLEELVSKGANISAVDNQGRSPLHRASLDGKAEIVEDLVRHGADVNAADKNGNCPLHIAAQEGHVLVVEALIAHGADVNTKASGGETALFMATVNEHTDIVKELLSRGADANAVKDDSWTSLIYAAKNGDAVIAKALIDNGANVNTSLNDGWTALHEAARYGYTEIVEVLLESNANVDAVEDAGWTALHSASYHGQIKSARVLVAAGASKVLLTHDKSSPLDLVCGAPDCSCSDNIRDALVELLTP